jgi:hypothetical protein
MDKEDFILEFGYEINEHCLQNSHLLPYPTLHLSLLLTFFLRDVLHFPEREMINSYALAEAG